MTSLRLTAGRLRTKSPESFLCYCSSSALIVQGGLLLHESILDVLSILDLTDGESSSQLGHNTSDGWQRNKYEARVDIDFSSSLFKRVVLG